MPMPRRPPPACSPRPAPWWSARRRGGRSRARSRRPRTPRSARGGRRRAGSRTRAAPPTAPGCARPGGRSRRRRRRARAPRRSAAPRSARRNPLTPTLTQLCQGTATLFGQMDALTIHEAAEPPGWSPRMRRYVERVGLVDPARWAPGYRLYGPAELQRLRTLRELLDEHEIGLSDLAFALRLRRDGDLRRATDAWLEAQAQQPADVPADDWLRFEQEKHQRLLAALRVPPNPLSLETA